MIRDTFDGVIPFVHVAQQGSFHGAAAELGVTPAAISKAVRKLEDELGVTLLHRTTRTVQLSAAGEVFLNHCVQALSELRQGFSQVEAARQEISGLIIISVPLILGGFITTRLGALLTPHPELRVELRATDHFANLVEDRVDIAVRIGELRDSSLVARRLSGTRRVCVASPAYLDAHPTPRCPEALARHTCLAFRGVDGRIPPWLFRVQRDRDEFSPRVVTQRITVNDGQLLVEGALAGLGIAYVFEYLVEEHLSQGRLVEVLADYTSPGPPIHALCLPGQQQHPRIRAALDFLIQCFQPSPPTTTT